MLWLFMWELNTVSDLDIRSGLFSKVCDNQRLRSSVFVWVWMLQIFPWFCILLQSAQIFLQLSIGRSAMLCRKTPFNLGTCRSHELMWNHAYFQLQWPDNGASSFHLRQEYAPSYATPRDPVVYPSPVGHNSSVITFSIPGCIEFDSGHPLHPIVIESTLQKYIRSLVKILVDKCKDIEREPDPLELEWLATKIVDKYPQFRDQNSQCSHVSDFLWPPNLGLCPAPVSCFLSLEQILNWMQDHH
jgi:hypothetical protein